MKRMKSYTKALAGITAVLMAAAQMPAGTMTGSAVAAEESAVSTENTIAPKDNYAKLLQYSLYFYDANMCGNKVEDATRLSWRKNCHTADSVQGGFHDAGDHLMLGLPQGQAAATLGWSYYEFKEAYEQTGQSAHFKSIMDYFCDFFKASAEYSKDTGEVTALLTYKGAYNDHQVWEAPEVQQDERDEIWVKDGSSDIAAEYAAALALNYLNFHNPEDLTYAQALYNFALKYSALDRTGSYYYPSETCADDFAWAAGCLYLATEADNYKKDCEKFLAVESNQNPASFNWNNVSDAAAIVYAEITGDWNDAESRILKRIEDASKEYRVSDGLVTFNGWGNLRYNSNVSLCSLVIDKHSEDGFNGEWSKSQMDYILGENGYNANFVIGFADNSVQNPHHRAATHLDVSEDWHEFNYSDGVISEEDGHLLIGALVGGPSSVTSYEDDFRDSTSNEVTLDYNSALVGVAAGLYCKYGTGEIDNDILTKFGENNTDRAPMYRVLKADFDETASHAHVVAEFSKEVTCTEDGVTGGQECELCGEILSEGEKIPALKHIDENKDGICDREDCQETINEAGSIAGFSAALGDEISFDIYVDISENVDPDSASMKFVIDNGSLDPIVLTDEVSMTEVSGKNAAKFTVHVPAKNMYSKITAQIYNGEEPVGDAFETSFAAYVKSLADKNPECRQLAAKMLHYGRYAAAYWNIEDIAAETSYDAADFERIAAEIGDNSKAYENALPENYYGSSLLLVSTIELRHYMKDGTYVSEKVKPIQYAASGKYGVNDYIYKVLCQNDTEETSLKELCAALYEYGAEAAKIGG